MKDYKRTLITTALPYANGPVHIGHLAGVYVPADIYARYMRLQGREVLMIGGSDEHGVPITLKAREEGVTPQDIVDRYHKIIKDSFEEFGISFDVYGRTTSETHRRVASDFFRRLYDKGEFIEKTSMQLYDEEAGRFLADRYVKGTCPHCGNTDAYGDQCEACGTSLNATDLIDPRSAITDSKPVLRETKHYFLPLDKWQPALEKWILEEHEEWKPNVYGQCKSWLDLGLQPRAVSRDLDWGIPVPVEGNEGKVLYVWFDAPIGYISNTIDLVGDDYTKWWKDPETRMLHFIGKDNIVFHCIVFPSMLMADGTYNLPDNVPANEFLNLEDDKISTSRNWAVWLHEYLRDFPGKQDVLRYVLTANAPETKDNNFTWKDFQTHNNSELVAILGNFVNRAVVLTHKYFDDIVPEAGPLTESETSLEAELEALKGEMTEALESFRFREAVRAAMDMARAGNRYLQETEPWKVAKTDMARAATILNTAIGTCANLAVAFAPFLPFMSEKLGKMLGLGEISWDMLGGTGLVPAGTKIGEPELLFEKIDDEAIQAQVNKLLETKKANERKNADGGKKTDEPEAWTPEPVKEECSFDDFAKVDIRVGRVLECEKVKKSKKLLRFLIDDGFDKRTILSGIAESYPEPAELVGKEVCFIANFAPRKMMGIESQGMILSAVNPDGTLTLISPSAETTPGAEVG